MIVMMTTMMCWKCNPSSKTRRQLPRALTLTDSTLHVDDEETKTEKKGDLDLAEDEIEVFFELSLKTLLTKNDYGDKMHITITKYKIQNSKRGIPDNVVRNRWQAMRCLPLKGAALSLQWRLSSILAFLHSGTLYIVLYQVSILLFHSCIYFYMHCT